MLCGMHSVQPQKSGLSFAAPKALKAYHLALAKVIYATMSVMRSSRSSAYVIREAILKFYDDKKLWPRGLTSAMECIQDWALRMGDAIKRMAAQLPIVCTC